MLPNSIEKAWLYHRGKWSKIWNPLYDEQFPDVSTASRPPTWRQVLREYDRKLCNLGPALPPPNYSGVLVSVYAYTGGDKVPAYLIRIISIGLVEIMYAQDLPDLLAVLALLAPMASNGIFTDAYIQGQKNRGGRK